MSIRAYSPADYPKLVAWWDGHRAVALPEAILPRGWIVSGGGIDVAMAFLLQDVGGKFAVVEFLTTNPKVSYSRTLVQDVKDLLEHIEAVAGEHGATFIISFSAVDSGEERLLKRLGFTPADGKPHRILCKPLTVEAT